MSRTVTRKAPTTAAMKLVSSDPSNTGCYLINYGSVIVYLGTSSGVTSATGEPLYPKGFKRYSGNPGDIYGITASGTADVSVEVLQGGTSHGGRLDVSGISMVAAANHSVMSDGSNLVEATVKTVFSTSAITANSTTTTEAAGTIGYTSNATGIGHRFVSDGSKWQLDTLYAEQVLQTDEKTIATTGNTDAYVIAPEAGILASVDFSAIDALAQHASNYLTFSITNLGQSGAGSTVMLAATDANTTKTSTGAAISAHTKRSLTLTGTAADLVVAKGDRLRVRFASAATLANTVTGSKALLRFTRLS